MNTRQNGFTLLEVLVAVAILAFVMSMVISGSVDHSRNALTLKQKTMAAWVARNHLAELHLADEWPDIGSRQDSAMMGNIEWDYEVIVNETPDGNIRRIDIRVYEPAGADIADARGREKYLMAEVSGFMNNTPGDRATALPAPDQGGANP